MKTDLANAPRIVILAAGFSSRLGRPKALVRVRGRSLLARTVAILRPWAADAIVVVVPARAARYRAGLRAREVEFVVNGRRERGLSSSVLTGVRRARHSAAVMILPLDLVELHRRDVARLIGRWRAHRRKVVARRIGPVGGTPLILPHRFFALLGHLEGDRGLRDFVRELPRDGLMLVTMDSAAADVDTPADLERARRRVRPGSTDG